MAGRRAVMGGALDTLVVLATPLALGVLVLRAIGIHARDGVVFALGAAGLCGSLSLGAITAAWLWLGLPVEPGFARAIAAASVLGAAGVLWRPPRVAVPRAAPPWETALFVAAVAVCAWFVADVAYLTRSVPILVGDESAIWASKAKAYYGAATDGPPLSVSLREHFVQHPDYPALNPLLQSWAFWVAGDITLAFNRVPIQALSVALVLAFAGAVRLAVRPACAAVLVLAFTAIGQTLDSARSAMADAMVALGFVVAVTAWLRFAATREPRWWRLCGLALAFCAFSKHEGLLLAGALLAGIAARACVRGDPARELLGRRAAWLTPLALVLAGTWLHNGAFELEHDMTRGGPAGLASHVLSMLGERAWTVASYFTCDIYLDAGVSGLVVVAFVVLLAVSGRAAFDARIGAVTLALLAALMVQQLVFVGTFQTLEWHLQTAAGRLVYQAVPAIGAWNATVIARVLPVCRGSSRDVRTAVVDSLEAEP